MKWLLLLLLAACSVETTETYDFVTINDLIMSNTPQTCDWDYERNDDIGTYNTNGSFVSTGTAYYLVNTVEKDSGSTTKYAVYDGTEIYLWNDQTVQPIGQQMGPENYMMVVYNNTISYATYFDMLNHVDYEITCTDNVGTLPELPELNWLTI